MHFKWFFVVMRKCAISHLNFFFQLLYCRRILGSLIGNFVIFEIHDRFINYGFTKKCVNNFRKKNDEPVFRFMSLKTFSLNICATWAWFHFYQFFNWPYNTKFSIPRLQNDMKLAVQKITEFKASLIFLLISTCLKPLSKP